MYINILIYIHADVHTYVYIYIYEYIPREREREMIYNCTRLYCTYSRGLDVSNGNVLPFSDRCLPKLSTTSLSKKKCREYACEVHEDSINDPYGCKAEDTLEKDGQQVEART